MPLFEFVCPNCKRVEEILQRYNDPPPVCRCKGEDAEMQRRVGGGSFILNGSGWYRDHYGLKK